MVDPRLRYPGLVLGLLALQGCLPFALPPGKASLGIGSRHHDRGFKGPGTGSGMDPVWQVRGAIHPLGLAPSLHGRSFDFGIGYSIENETDQELTIQGPFLDLEYFLWHSEGTIPLRLGTILSPSWITGGPGVSSNGLDGGLDLRLELESSIFNGVEDFSNIDDKPDGKDGSAVLGWSYGELSIGAWVGGGFRSVGENNVWSLALGISGRWPAIAGVICCLDFDDD
ncbi:MAG: hypothetical protein RL033_7813 [Pseudomonadota bacterium]|jgi:hypothetical protein